MGARGFPKQPPAMAAMNGRNVGTDSGDRKINFGPEMGRPDDLVKPAHLSDFASVLWDFIVSELKGSSVLRSCDATALEAGCETYARYREALEMRVLHGITREDRFGQVVKAPWIAIEETASKQLQSWLREFGLTPSAVSGLMPNPGTDDVDNPFEWTQS